MLHTCLHKRCLLGWQHKICQPRSGCWAFRLSILQEKAQCTSMIQINFLSPGYINHDHSWGEEEKIIIDVWILSETKANSRAGQCVSDISFKLSQLCKCGELWASQGELSSLPVLLTPTGALGGTEPTLVLQRCGEKPVASPGVAAETKHHPRTQELPTRLEERPCDLHRPFLSLWVMGKGFTCSRIWGGSSSYSLQNLWMQ